ncbi:Ribonuclease H1 [Operophtera brumata]|uniref:Ribonuclease H n=1 Tax=Operophtera brumata TaxID=104452 RepID=A0A0L7L8R2_OPEBR|nr:Ribonuclease H1 [Operophtera brumata]
MPYYGVAKGRSPGVYQNWGDCENQIKGYSGATYRKFNSASSAHEFVASHGGGSGYASNYGGSGSCSNYNPKRSCGQSGRYGFETDSDGYVQVYTDGACLDNGRDGARAGIGVYWGDGHPLNTSAPVSGRATNNTAEIQAATWAMKQAFDNGIYYLAINTDSQFLMKSVTEWMPRWKQVGWKLANGGPVKNERDFKELDKAMGKLNVKWNYVQSHHGVDGNEKADQLAKAGASK